MDLQRLSFYAFAFALGAIFILKRLKRFLTGRFFFSDAALSRRRLWVRALVLLGFDFFFYSLLQVLFTLSFAVCYVLFIRNGLHPDAGDLGVAFVFVETLVCGLGTAWGLFSRSRLALLPALTHCGLLAYKWVGCALRFGAGGSSKYLGYIVFNPVFGFVGAPCTSTPFFCIHLLSALLPAVCFALGHALAGQSIALRASNT